MGGGGVKSPTMGETVGQGLRCCKWTLMSWKEAVFLRGLPGPHLTLQLFLIFFQPLCLSLRACVFAHSVHSDWLVPE